ncbi:MAG: circadian clock protein KaiA [Gomphosphaeria aponina SAG 52.96 = DSM 107014]|uniref:Circadian clock oscillator protein KaiA n=1 Tax=Gomphosphaeria aponina SAG 52.96 = DSM 107014 TaxID=1521640 RepID=A0A941GS20_9CHRO|nr:circadian clock protein KaiA [Gomphosphaeria aponina SAG 52.96 = DSM 107014]
MRESTGETWRDRYNLTEVNSTKELLDFVEENKEQTDCLVVLTATDLQPVFNQLHEEGILLPAIIIEQEELSFSNNGEIEEKLQEDQPKNERAIYLYHSGELRVKVTQLGQIASLIDQAIAQFLHLGPSCTISEKQETTKKSREVENQQNFLLLQQRRLAEKLKERLGYLGIYYKRNPQFFYRHLSAKEKKQLLNQLSLEYRNIIINYFDKEYAINQAIDQFVNRAFFADFSVSQILEMHMELMDEFAQHLKLEGRSEEILLDYRLALIDIIAHLCEMYRRSIPREDLPFELLFPID